MQIIETRAFNLLQLIIKNNNLSVDSAMTKLDCSERQLHYDLSKINSMLKEQQVDPIKISKKRFFLKEETAQYIQDANRTEENYIVCGDNRIWMISIMVFCAKEPLGIAHFTYAFKSSKNTVLNDFKKLNAFAAQYRVRLEYSRELGYHFEGTPKNIRTLVLFSISTLKEGYFCKQLIASTLESKSFIGEYRQTERTIKAFIDEMNLPVITDYLEQAVYFIALLPYHCNSIAYHHVEFHEPLWMHLPLYAATTKLYSLLPASIKSSEIEYLFILLLTMTLGNEEYFQVYTKESILLKNLAKELADRFEVITGSSFVDKQKVTGNILMHLQPAYFRLKHGIPVVNPILDQIKQDYGEIFSICRLVLEPFADYLGCFIPDDEIGYIAIHFLAMLDSQDSGKMRVRAVIICQNGIASSVMIRNQLVKLFPEILFKETYTLAQFRQLPLHEYDVVFSTCNIIAPEGKKLFLVSPIISAAEKFALTEAVYETVFGYKRDGLTIGNIIDVVSQYADIHDQDALIQALSTLMYRKQKSERRDGLPVIKDLLTPDMIQFAKSAPGWEAAIKLAAQPLLDKGCIERSYIESMIQNVKEFGPYIVICPLIAIPHATTKSGVKKLGMSYLKLEEPVNILDNPEKAVKLFITLAAVDNNTHLKALAQLTTILSEAASREKLLECSTVEEVLVLLD